MSEPQDIPSLIEKARTGDQAAFEELVTPLGAALRARIVTRMGEALRRKLDVEDVVQETLFRAFRSIRHFRWQGEGSVERWLEGIAANFILHAARSERRRKEIRLQREPRGTDVSPSRHQRRRERFDRLKRSIEDLAPDYRTVIQLSRIEGLKVKEIAKRLGRSESAIKNLLLRAMKQLRESFGDTESMSLSDRHRGDGEVRDGRE